MQTPVSTRSWSRPQKRKSSGVNKSVRRCLLMSPDHSDMATSLSPLNCSGDSGITTITPESVGRESVIVKSSLILESEQDETLLAHEDRDILSSTTPSHKNHVFETSVGTSVSGGISQVNQVLDCELVDPGVTTLEACCETKQLFSFWFEIHGNFNPENKLAEKLFVMKLREFEYLEVVPGVVKGFIKFKRSTRISAVNRLLGTHLKVNLWVRKPMQGGRQYAKLDTSIPHIKHGYKTYNESPEKKDQFEKFVQESLCQVGVLTKRDAMKQVEEKRLKDYVFHKSKYEAYFEEKFKAPVPPKYKISDFKRDAIDSDILRRKTCLLVGPTSTGKTKYAQAHGESPYTLTNLDMLKDLDAQVHSHVVIDEADFDTCTPEECLALCDLEGPGQIHIRYVVGIIPQGMPRIITSNKMLDKIFPKHKFNEFQWAALEGRIAIFPIEEQLFDGIPERTRDIDVEYPFYRIPNTNIIVEVNQSTNYAELHSKFKRVLGSTDENKVPKRRTPKRQNRKWYKPE